MSPVEMMLNERLHAGGGRAPRQHSPANSHGEVSWTIAKEAPHIT
jgi:hypothetical protein